MKNLPAFGELRALDRLTDGQLAAVELMVLYGLPAGRVAQRLAIDDSTVRRWLRDPRFIAACCELTRSYAASQLVPLALYQCRRLLLAPDLKPRDAVAVGRFAGELAGLYASAAPMAGVYSPALTIPTRPIDQLTAAELAAASARAESALAQLADSESDSVDPLS